MDDKEYDELLKRIEKNETDIKEAKDQTNYLTLVMLICFSIAIISLQLQVHDVKKDVYSLNNYCDSLKSQKPEIK